MPGAASSARSAPWYFQSPAVVRLPCRLFWLQPHGLFLPLLSPATRTPIALFGGGLTPAAFSPLLEPSGEITESLLSAPCCWVFDLDSDRETAPVAAFGMVAEEFEIAGLHYPPLFSVASSKRPALSLAQFHGMSSPRSSSNTTVDLLGLDSINRCSAFF
jgi:hypothetical protein